MHSGRRAWVNRHTPTSSRFDPRRRDFGYELLAVTGSDVIWFPAAWRGSILYATHMRQ